MVIYLIIPLSDRIGWYFYRFRAANRAHFFLRKHVDEPSICCSNYYEALIDELKGLRFELITVNILKESLRRRKTLLRIRYYILSVFVQIINHAR